MKLQKPTAQHAAFRDEMIAVLKKHTAILPAVECLAVAAYTVGQLIALQDQRKVSPAMAFEIVAQNIEQGNADIISDLGEHKGTA